MTQLAHAADTTTYREIYFIDDGLTDVDTLLAALPDGAPWYLIDRNEDGVQQMAEVLAEHAGLMAVHVLAHGTPGRMQLGNASIDRTALLRQVCLWEEIGAALDPDGDLLFYACELAGGRRGTDFIDTVYQLTGANVAASRSLVGAAELGGSWDLDARVGAVKARAVNVDNYSGVLASPTVIQPVTLDATFDQPLDAADPGIVSTSFGGTYDVATAVLVDLAGKVTVAGSRDFGSAFYVARYNADGSPDTTFSGDGMATASFGGAPAAANAIAIDSLARIVAVGMAGDQYAIARFNYDGTPDTSFGVNGELTGSFGAAVFSTANGIAFAGNDIVIAGTADNDFGVARINEAGTLTQSVTTDIAVSSQDFVAAVAVLGSTILVAGSAFDGADSNFVLAKYNLVDLSLSGITNVDFGGGMDVASAMAIDAAGRAVLAGTRFSGVDKDFVIARYGADGNLDASFGVGGLVVTDFAGGDDEAFAVAIQGDGKIVVSGRTSVAGGQYDTVFARYNPDGTLDAGFGGDGLMTVAANLGGVPSDDFAAAMAISGDGEIIAVGSAVNAATGQTGALIINLTPVVPTLAAVAEDTVNPLGASVSSLVAANFSDPDLGDSLGGIAIAGDNSPGQGVWEYSSDNGANWFAVGLVDPTNALLVAAGDLLRFVPAADFNGTPGGLTLHLVDTASGVTFSNGATRQVLLNGSATAGVSVDTLTLSTSVSAVADAPTLSPAILADVVEGDVSPLGASVLDLFGAGFADVDGLDVLAGIAIAGDASTAAQGVWEYSLDGVVWSMVGPVSAGAALLLDASAQLRFVPTTDFQGIPGALAVHAVDSSAVLAFTTDPGFPQTFDTANDAATSGVAVASVSLSVTVTNVSDAPTILYSMTPDPAFGNGGLVTTEFGTAINEVAVGVALQSGGQVVVAGSTFDGVATQFAVARYDAGGALDGSFGTGGKVTTQFAEGNATAEAVAVAPLSNKIMVAGSVTDGFQADFAVARYDAVTGALDTTFGGDGKVTTAIGTGDDVATSISVDGGGQIVLAGYTFNGTDNDIAVARYNLDGTLDANFAGDGVVTVDFGGTIDEANAVQALGNGKVIVAGSSNGVFAVARFNDNGTLDTTFDVDGVLTTDVGGFGFSIATTILEQADGKILVGGYASGADFLLNFALVRYNADGSLDLGFGSGGVVITDFGQGDDLGASVIIDGDGKIVLSGSAADGLGGEDIAFARYNGDGSLDTSFGTGGLLQLAVGSGAAAAIASTLTTGGNVLAVGTAANVDTTTDFAVVQLTAATSVALASIDEDPALVLGDTVANLFGNSFHDVDGDLLAGVAVSANTATPNQGVWQYSTDAGTSWFAVGGVSAGAALLLAADSLLRFLPATDYNGTPGGLAVHLVDSSNTAVFTNGALTQVFDTAGAGGGSAVSANSIGLVTSVLPINDAPTGSDATLSVVEDNARVLSAADFGFADIDAGDVLAAVEITDISVPGTLTLNGFTVFPFDVVQRADIDAGLLVFQPLANGSGAAYASISFLVNDGTGSALLPNTLTFDVTAVNDAPVLTVDTAGAVSEDATTPTLTDSGLLSVSDPDAGDVVTVSSAYNSDAVWSGGTLSLAQIATLTAGFSNDLNSWNYNVANAELQFLGAGQTVSFSYTVTATDNSGAINNSASQVVTMTLTGANDAPVLSVDTAGVVTRNDAAATLTDSGVLSFSDVDAGDTVTVGSAYNGDAVWSGGALSLAQIAALTAGFSNDLNSWDYSVANAELQFLGAGETVSFSYTVTATDDSGAINNSASQVVTMTLTGANDAPVLSVDVAGGVTEDAASPTLTDSGLLSVSDANASDLVTVSSAYNGDAVWSGGTLSLAQVAALTGGFSNDLNSWDYSVANADLQFLGAGETVTFSVTVTATDDSGAANNSASQIVTMTLTGTNDAPALTVDVAGGVSEDAASPTLTDSGVLSFSDADGDLVTVSSAYNSDAVWSGGTLSLAQVAALTAGFSNDLNSWDYSVANAELQFLAAGETVSFSYTVTATDNSGAGNNVASQVVTMTLTGSNDAPALTVDVAGGVTEDAASPTLTDSGALSFSDADAGDLVTVSSAYNNDAVWSGGALSLAQIAALTAGFSNDQNSWDYSIANADLQFLGFGETVTFSYTVTATDDSGAINNSASQVVTMTLSGANHAPVLTVDVAGGVSEDAASPTLTDSGALSFSDADAGDLVTVSSAYNSDAVWSGGTLSAAQIAALTAGFSNDQASWNYSVANADLQFLGAGETVTFSYTVTATDDSGAINNNASQVVTLTLTGTNDAPALTAAAAALGSGTEGVAYTVSLAQLLAGWTDPDGDPLAVANLVADHGTVTDNQDGTFTVTPSAYYYGAMNLGYDVIDGRSGVVAATLAYTLANVRSDMYVPGSVGGDNLWGDQFDAGSWDTLDGGDGDDSLHGLGGNDSLYGGTGTDWLDGGSDLDSLWGGDGDDVLIGGLGADSLTGGVGNDVYEVTDAGDLVVEAASEGSDTIWTSLTSYTLEDNVEKLMFGGSGNFAGTGTGGDNLIQGKEGDDTLNGLAGNDVLIGGWGADTLTGGVGDDVYEVTDAGDQVVEAATEGTDTIWTSLSSYTLAENVENLMFGGSGNFAGTGNAAGNLMQGKDGDDVLEGLAGNDSLIGGWGADTLTGGVGNDVYEVTDAGDVVIETAGEGDDTVWTSLASYTLAENVENLMFGGSGNFAGTGNGLGNVIQGKDGNDVLNGLGGNDALIGGGGNDVFVFASGFGKDGVLDFDADPAAGQDLLDISGLGITAATFGSAVTIQDLGADLLLSFAGGNSIHLAGIGDAAAITASDFVLAA